MAKQKYYVVWVGSRPGVYTNWSECQAQVNGFEGAKFKAFPTLDEAEQAYQRGWKGNWGNSGNTNKHGVVSSSSGSKSKTNSGKSALSKRSTSISESQAEVDYHTISVDVGTAGNPGPIEYKGVDTATGEVLFSVGPIPNGTNNLGEYLAIVHALAFIAKTGDTRNIYSDSMTAMKWVKQKAPNTTLPRNASTHEVWTLVDRATQWLSSHTYHTKIMKWQTDRWGEIKADYGRK
jgi:ribonuclease HI